MISIKRLENNVKNARLKHGVNAVLSTLDDWQLRAQMLGLVLDTASSNTRLNMGACTLIERALGTDLVWIACRHHVFEVMLSDVFSVACIQNQFRARCRTVQAFPETMAIY